MATQGVTLIPDGGGTSRVLVIHHSRWYSIEAFEPAEAWSGQVQLQYHSDSDPQVAEAAPDVEWSNITEAVLTGNGVQDFPGRDGCVRVASPANPNTRVLLILAAES